MNHFTRAELERSKVAKERGIENRVPDRLLGALSFTLAGCERVRACLGFPMPISSGYRCPDLNDAVGGAESSQHLAAEAVDFTCPGFGTPEQIVHFLTPLRQMLGIDQLILEEGWVHMSFTLEPRYQVLRARAGGFDVLA